MNMTKEGDYTIENFYQGGYSSLSPNYGDTFTGFRGENSKLGVSTDPRTADILKEISDKIAPGQKVIELSLIQPEILEAIPKQHLKEVNRLSKLTGVDVTVHGPLVDASGVSDRGFNETQREIAERKILNAIKRSHEINPDGNIPVTFHTANQLPGARYVKKGNEEYKDFMAVVNQETGQINAVKREEKFYPGNEGPEIRTVENEVGSLNNSDWLNNLTSIEQYRKEADALLSDNFQKLAPIMSKIDKGEKINLNELSPEEYDAYQKLNRADIYLQNIESNFNSLYNRAWKYPFKKGEDKIKETLNLMRNEWIKENNEMAKSGNMLNIPFLKSEQLKKGIELMKNLPPPQVYRSAEDYAIEKSNESFGNAAWESYKEFKDKAPIISIENPPAGFGLSRGEDLKNLVEGSRKKFIENATKNGMSESAAKKQAEKLIGATWDVGHINQLRQFGFSGKDIVGEAKKVAPYVKHVHLSDNFGTENVELPMGMGNVDFKEVMKELGEKGKNAKKIVEAAHWWQFQRSSPVGVSMEALGTPIYSMNMAPYWNQSVGLQQGYFGGYGAFLPSINYETFGAGFSNLPAELGGQRHGGRSRMSGAPLE